MGEPTASDLLTIGELAHRSGVATSALRYYESIGLITSGRTEANQRRFVRSALRTISLIRVAQGLGLGLDEIRAAFTTLPNSGAPSEEDWVRLSNEWRTDLDGRIARLKVLRDDLTSCIGCGCLSLARCALFNRNDKAAALGAGARYLLGDSADGVADAL